MKERFFVYFRLQLKRAGKLIPFVLAVTAVIFACVYLLGGMIMDMNSGGEQQKKMRIGVAGEADDPYVGLAIYALQNFDSSRFSLSFEQMEEEQAKSLLKAGKLNAYIVIPEGFVEAANYGINDPVTYVTTDGAVGIGSLVMSEVADAVSDMVLESQNAVYGMQRYIKEQGIETDLWVLTNGICENYLIKILDRESMYELEIVGYSDGLSYVGYYVCGISVLFLLIWGMSCSPLFVNRDTALCRVLHARGQKVWTQVLAEYGAYFLLMALSMLCVAAIAAVGLEITGYSLPEWEQASSGDVMDFFVSMLPVVALVSAMQFLLYELVSGPVNGILLQFLSAVSLGYLSGCLYPISFFPEGMKTLGEKLPTGVGRIYLSKCLLGQEAGDELTVIMLYFTAFLLLAAAVRKKKIS